MMTLLDIALTYAAKGWQVFPCQPGGKKPITTHGLKDATTNRAQITAWWQREPNANIALATGAISNVMVLDVDSEDAEAELRKLEAAHGELPESVEAITGKGRHNVRKLKRQWFSIANPPPRVITFTRFAEVALAKVPRYIVRGLIPSSGLVVFWGPPKCGKSFLVFDMVAHVAAGWLYRGRKVRQCDVAYCALEGQTGFQARVEAFRQAHNVSDGIPLRVSGDRLQLPSDTANIIKSIEDQFDIPPGIVVLDTLNRSLEGSENDPADMGRYVQAADAIREAFDCVVIVVHHCGVEGTRPRGHTSLTGAADAQIAVRRDDDGNIVAKVEWMKDGQEGDEIVSQLEVRNVGTDGDKEEITSCVVRPAIITTEPKPREPKLAPNQKTMLLILRGADRHGLLTEEWNELGKKAGIGAKRRADLTDAQNGLKSKGLVHEFRDRWHASKAT
jgi:hypothetical protein